MNFVSTELDLPLFLISRNPFKYPHSAVVRNYINQQKKFYEPLCTEVQKDADKQTATHKKFQHLVGLDETKKTPCPPPKPLKTRRDLITPQPWQMPPNRYNVADILRRNRALSWRHPKHEPLQPKGPKPHWRFYEKPEEMARMKTFCHKHKGIMLSNARKHRATARCMVTNMQTCYRDRNEPTATSYYSKLHEIGTRVATIKPLPKPNPYVFLPQSIVPLKASSIHPPHVSYKPAPGRYETRYIDVCQCSSRLTYEPEVVLMIEQQKRFKFRRLPYIKIKARSYCSPEWRHVKGNGYRRLFQKPRKQDVPEVAVKTVKKREAKKAETNFQLFPDARYISMINNPNRVHISIRDTPLPDIPPTVVFNCTSKRVVRRQLHNNKKIAFNSGQERFKDSYRVPVPTAKQLEALKASLPPERRLRDYPVMRAPSKEIGSKLQETPLHMRPAYDIPLRKRLFKFLPLPGPKVLVMHKELRSHLPEGQSPLFYGQKLDVNNYLKK